MNQQVSIKVVSYDESNDSFDCEISNAALIGSHYETHTLDASVLPLMVGHYGEPNEFVGKTFALSIIKLTREQIIAELDSILGAPDGSDLTLSKEQVARVRELRTMLFDL